MTSLLRFDVLCGYFIIIRCFVLSKSSFLLSGVGKINRRNFDVTQMFSINVEKARGFFPGCVGTSCFKAVACFYRGALHAYSRRQDLKRTLGMKDVSPLRNVLRCMSTFVPDVGYVQVWSDLLLPIEYSLF